MKAMGRLTTLVLVVVVGLNLISQSAVAASQSSNLTITIAVRNYARVDKDTLVNAEDVATQIFRETGLETKWLDLALEPEGQQEVSRDPKIFQIQLGLIPADMADRLHFRNNVMGFAPGEGLDRQVVYVFYDRVEDMARFRSILIRNPSKAQILGTVIDHEIGHVLLNVESHSSKGIMRGHWDLWDLQDIANGRLFFTSSQCEIIRTEVVKRVGQRKPLQVAGLPIPAMPLDAADFTVRPSSVENW